MEGGRAWSGVGKAASPGSAEAWGPSQITGDDREEPTVIVTKQDGWSAKPPSVPLHLFTRYVKSFRGRPSGTVTARPHENPQKCDLSFLLTRLPFAARVLSLAGEQRHPLRPRSLS